MLRYSRRAATSISREPATAITRRNCSHTPRSSRRFQTSGDIAVRFTFTTENGVGFESFKVAVTEVLRIADQYTPILDEFMRKE